MGPRPLRLGTSQGLSSILPGFGTVQGFGSALDLGGIQGASSRSSVPALGRRDLEGAHELASLRGLASAYGRSSPLGVKREGSPSWLPSRPPSRAGSRPPSRPGSRLGSRTQTRQGSPLGRPASATASGREPALDAWGRSPSRPVSPLDLLGAAAAAIQGQM